MMRATVNRAYNSRRIDAGLYIQPSNDLKRFYVIAKCEDSAVIDDSGNTKMITYWSWGELTDRIVRDVERASDPEDAIDLLLGAAQNFGVSTKAEAIAEALSQDAGSVA